MTIQNVMNIYENGVDSTLEFTPFSLYGGHVSAVEYGFIPHIVVVLKAGEIRRFIKKK